MVERFRNVQADWRRPLPQDFSDAASSCIREEAIASLEPVRVARIAAATRGETSVPRRFGIRHPIMMRWGRGGRQKARVCDINVGVGQVGRVSAITERI
jgi:hypothetical protein